MPIAATARRCKKCAAPLGAEDKLCVKCGTHQTSGVNAKTIQTAYKAGRVGRALAVSAAVAAVCGVLWAGFTIATNYEIGYAAIGLGFVTGAVVRAMAGGQTSTMVGLGAAGNAFLGLLVAKLIMGYNGYGLSPFDLLWLIFACGTAFNLGSGKGG